MQKANRRWTHNTHIIPIKLITRSHKLASDFDSPKWLLLKNAIHGRVCDCRFCINCQRCYLENELYFDTYRFRWIRTQNIHSQRKKSQFFFRLLGQFFPSLRLAKLFFIFTVFYRFQTKNSSFNHCELHAVKVKLYFVFADTNECKLIHIVKITLSFFRDRNSVTGTNRILLLYWYSSELVFGMILEDVFFSSLSLFSVQIKGFFTDVFVSLKNQTESYWKWDESHLFLGAFLSGLREKTRSTHKILDGLQ